MFSWFYRAAPIRTKFSVLTLLMGLYFCAASALLVFRLKETAGSLDVVVLLSAGALTVGTMLLARKAICDPYVTTVERMEALARGDLASEVRYTHHSDCVGRLTRAMAIFRDNAEQVQTAGEAARKAAEAQMIVVGALAEGLDALAAGNLTTRITQPFPEEFEALRANFTRAVAALNEAMSSTRSSTNGVHVGAQEIRKASDDMARRTELQAANLEEVAASLGEITRTVRSSAEDASRADQAAGRARQEAVDAAAIARRAVQAMTGIEKASREISEISSVIDGIAFQTNLLALNAGVEAARAGESGRGFAVVASEVRALAQRSAEAAKDISYRLQTTAVEIVEGVKLVTTTGDALDRITGRICEVSQLVSTMANATESQAQGLVQINSAVSEMDQVTQQNAAMVEQSTAAARSLDGEVAALMDLVGRFRIDDQATPREQPARRLAASPRLAVIGGRVAVAQDSDWTEF